MCEKILTGGECTVKKKPIHWRNLLIGAALQLFEVSTLGQPFEVLKTHMAAHRGDNLIVSTKKTYARGGISGFYQGLIPWAWIEASTKGAVLLFSASEIEYHLKNHFGLSPSLSGVLSGMGGGLAQAYTTVGFCTFMKTVEVTRHKQVGSHVPSWKIARSVLQEEGIRGINKGVTAVALRQMTNWGSRIGISRLSESLFKGNDQDRKLTVYERLLASVIGGALGCWNQPIEVIRVEMQSQTVDPHRPAKLNIWTTAKHIYRFCGLRGLYRGVVPRIGLSVYLTVCMVFGGDQVKERFGTSSVNK
eukprot:TRINITY_DN10624_c0_g1_i1.p1 TRINITY_DN10624_c0_g1~~TRINITY_DN10624_c0_g1_i1.p1  ORF type:complete len:304 (-),score=33.31 TRINITY_DN10624_c0_g1_i1:158-1069(-)